MDVVKAMPVLDERLQHLPEICRSAVAERACPGGVITAGQGDTVLAALAFGDRSVLPDREATTLDTIYDLASLTKPLVTATLLMQAVEAGLVNLMEPVGRWYDLDEGNRLDDVALRELLLHTSGLPATAETTGQRPGEILESVLRRGLTNEPGKVFLYSDVGFMLLADIVERILGAGLADLARTHIFEPLEMEDTGFAVTPEDLQRCAPTEMEDGEPMRGVVHDPVARQMGGVAGHAGLFGTASDLQRYCRMILARGALEGRRVLLPAAVDRMIAPVAVPGDRLRGLGWDVDTQYSSPRGDILPVRGVGHTGFTGASLWIDPPGGLYIVLLTNRVHPDGSGHVVRLRRLVANAIAAAVLG